MKSRVLVALALTLLGGQALAQQGPQTLPTQQFAPAPGGDNNYVTTQGAGVVPHLKPSVGLYLNYANDPLVLRRLDTDLEVSVIEHQIQLDLIAAIGFFDVLELGIAVPLTLYQAQGDNTEAIGGAPLNPPESFTTGDIRLYPKVSILNDPEGFGLAFLVPITLPTGDPESLQGNDGVTVEPRIVAELNIGKQFRLALSGGFIWRPEDQTFLNVDVGNEITFGAGVEYVFEGDDFGLIVEGYGKISVVEDTTSEENPIEVALAGRWWPAQNHALTLGVARGLTDGYGAPNFRVFLGYNYTPKGIGDSDGDGYNDDVDGCPDKAEDFDKFQDEDGCPDLDNDNDGIKDKDDKCPMEPEDYDGFQDADGCPDPDNDGDGILDVVDGPEGACKNDPEDMDGFEDSDGCPDPDNDGDNIPDITDGEVGENGFGACMNDAEDIDGFEDGDGCPDPDNDGDGILDVDDDCPDDPENKCNIRLDRCEIKILQQVFFAYDKDIIKEQSFPILNEVAEALKRHTWIELIEVQGHTDSDGTAEYNLDLSQRRSQAVVEFLVEKGVERSRLVGKGYGLSVPIAPNTTPAGRAKNRRVQFIIIKPGEEDCKKQ